jgi:septum formation protein
MAMKIMKANSLVLASASPRRAKLLRQLEVPFEILRPQVREIEGPHWSAGETARINAFRKACAVAREHPDALVIGVDTVVELGGKALSKPASRKEAGQMLWKLQGRTHRVMTAVCLILLRARRQKIFCEQTKVTFHPLSRAQIRHYHRLVDPLDKAGAYGIQDQGELLVEALSGSFSNVVGLPLRRLAMELRDFGFNVPGAAP